MGYKNYHKLPRIIRTPRLIFRIISTAVFCGALTISLTISLAHAIETTKASSLLLEKQQANISSLSPLASPFSREGKKQSPCFALLSHNSAPPTQDMRTGNNRQLADAAAVPAALGLVFGVRLVLGPKEIVPSSKRIQIGPEIRGSNDNGNSYALSIAAYRSCLKQEFLKSR